MDKFYKIIKCYIFNFCILFPVSNITTSEGNGVLINRSLVIWKKNHGRTRFSDLSQKQYFKLQGTQKVQHC
jgi:hypothetical protein